eukprot:gene2062-18243_t
MENLGPSRGPAAPDDLSRLSFVLEKISLSCVSSHQDWKSRVDILEAVSKAVVGMRDVVDPRIQPFGSFLSGFYNSNSDLDLALVGGIPANTLGQKSLVQIFGKGQPFEDTVPLHKLDKVSKKKLLRKVSGRLLDHGIGQRRDMEFILGARVEVDLCLGGSGTELKAAFISHVSMVIFYLQTRPEGPPLLPPLYQLLYTTKPEKDAPRILMLEPLPIIPQVLECARERSMNASKDFDIPATPLELFSGFVKTMGAHLRHACDNPTQ